MNVFLDTNVVIDFMGERKDFFASASTIFSMIEDGTIHASVSALTIINCAYILKKAFSQKVMLEKIGILCRLLDVTSINKSHLQKAINMKPRDYEDAVQYLSALTYHPDVIITRDKNGFSNFNIPILTPDEFVSKAKA